MNERAVGVVYLVGAGPGDPGLLTVRGADVLSRAEVVVHDRLTDQSLLALAPVEAEVIDVGKEPDDMGDQEAINRLLVNKAAEGRRVVRLKGGDPFVFGRGGEEALALLSAGVPFEVVPGVSSAVAAPTYAGVPVTHRGLASSFSVVGGHSRSFASPDQGGANWEALAATGGTIVVLMGAAHRGLIADRLKAAGLSDTTPVLAVQWATQPQQSVVRTTLGQLGDAVLAPPVTIVIGEVAALDLRSQEPLPLSGRTVVVTRASHQAEGLTSRLRRLGARVIEVPAIAIGPPADGGAELAAAVARLRAGAYTWAVFSSANAVEQFFAHVPDTRQLGKVLVAAVGSATEEALRRFRVAADLVPPEPQAEGLAAALPLPPGGEPGAGAVLLPQAAGARPQLAEGLARHGWRVDAVEAYRTLPRAVPSRLLAAAARADAICFASPSALNSYLEQASKASAGLPPVVVCIGPTTAAAARARGLHVAAEATEQTAEGLLQALVAVLAAAPG